MLMHKRFYNDRTVILIFYTVIIGTQKRSSLMGKLIITSKAGARTLVGLGASLFKNMCYLDFGWAFGANTLARPSYDDPLASTKFH